MQLLPKTRIAKSLIAIAALASLARLLFLDIVPPSLYWEEAALGYDAYSIFKTGKDMHGNTLPLVAFTSFGDFKPSGYFYAAAPFVGALGLNSWSVRLPAALAGTATVLVVYLIAREFELFRKQAVWIGLVLALMPWHVHFSRAAFEVVLATFFFSLGILSLLKARTKSWWLLPTAIFMAASMYTYHGLRLTAPLITLGVVTIFWQQFTQAKKWLLIALLLAVTLTLPLLTKLQSPEISQRFAETSFLPVSNAVSETNSLREEDGNSIFFRMVHHRYWYWMAEVAQKGLSHLSPLFLFVSGDNNPRHQTDLVALLFHWQALPLMASLVLLPFLRKGRKEFVFVLVWIASAAFPASLTTATPHTLRFLPATPAFALLVGWGSYWLFNWIKGKRLSWLWLIVAVGIIAGDLALWTGDYFLGYPYRWSDQWQYGYSTLVEYLDKNTASDTPVYISRAYGRPVIYFLYYLGYPPEKIQAQAEQAPKDQGEFLAFDRYHFSIPNKIPPGSVVASEKPLEGDLVTTIPFKNGEEAWYVYQY